MRPRLSLLALIVLPLLLEAGHMPPPPMRPGRDRVQVKLSDGSSQAPAEDPSRYSVGSDTGLFHPKRRPTGYPGDTEAVIDGRRDLQAAPDLKGSDFAPPLVEGPALETLSKALRDLESPNGATRQAALKTLVALGPTALSAVLRGTYDDDKKMRKGAYQTLVEVLQLSKKAKLETLGKLDHALAVPRLVEGLTDENKDVQKICAEALTRLGDTQAFQSLVRLMATLPREEDADSVTEVLSQMIHAPFISGLVSSVVGSGNASAKSVKKALQKIRTLEADKLGPHLAEASGPLGEALVGRLLALRHPAQAPGLISARLKALNLNPAVRVWHEISLGIAGEGSMFDTLLAHTGFKGDWGVRMEAIRAIKTLKLSPEARRKLIPALIIRQKDFYLAIRLEANAALIALTGMHRALEPDADALEAARVVRDWEDWWTDQAAEGAVDLSQAGPWGAEAPLTWNDKPVDFLTSTHKTVPPLKPRTYKGTWQGKVFHLSDDNGNGRFNDYGEDGLLWEGGRGGFLSRLILIDGRYHVLEVTVPALPKDFGPKSPPPAEGRFRVAPFTGRLGTLKILPTFAEGTSLERLVLRSGHEVVVSVERTQECKLPSGFWRIYEGELRNKGVAPDAKITSSLLKLYTVCYSFGGDIGDDPDGMLIIVGQVFDYYYATNEAEARAQCQSRWGSQPRFRILSVTETPSNEGSVSATLEKQSVLMIGPGRNRAVRVGDAYGRKAQMPLGQPLSLDAKVEVVTRGKDTVLVLSDPTFFGRRFGEAYYDGNPQPKTITVTVHTAQNGAWVALPPTSWEFQQMVNLLTMGSKPGGGTSFTSFERSDKWKPHEVVLGKYAGDLKILLKSQHPLLGPCEEVIETSVAPKTGESEQKVDPVKDRVVEGAAPLTMSLELEDTGPSGGSVKLTFVLHPKKIPHPLPPAPAPELEEGYKVGADGATPPPEDPGPADSSFLAILTGVSASSPGSTASSVTGDALAPLAERPLTLSMEGGLLTLEGFPRLGRELIALKPLSGAQGALKNLSSDRYWHSLFLNLWHWPQAGTKGVTIHGLDGTVFDETLLTLAAVKEGRTGRAHREKTSGTEAFSESFTLDIEGSCQGSQSGEPGFEGLLKLDLKRSWSADNAPGTTPQTETRRVTQRLRFTK